MNRAVVLTALFCLQFTFLNAAQVLLVGNPVGEETSLIIAALTKAKIDFKTVSNRDKALAREAMKAIDSVVIRIQDTSDSASLMDLSESDIWVDYLAARGTMIFMGDGMDLQAVPEGFFGAAGFSLKSNLAPAGTVHGVVSDLISHELTLNLGNAHETLSPVAGPKDMVMRYADGGPVMAIKHQSCAFRLVYWALLPSWITSAELAKVLNRSKDWCLGHALVPGNPAPDFRAHDLTDSELSFREHIAKSPGEIKVVEFMATWCSSCAKQLPHMIELAKITDPSKVSIHFVSYMEDAGTVQSYLQEHTDIDWPVIISKDGLGAQRYGVKALPALFILDSEGVVRHIYRKVTPAGTLVHATSQLQSSSVGVEHADK